MATVSDELAAEPDTVPEDQLDGQFLLDLFRMQAHLEQRRKETLGSWIEFLRRFDPTCDEDPYWIPGS